MMRALQNPIPRSPRAAPRPGDVPVFNPAFDITPALLIAGFVTDRGILNPPYSGAIRRMLAR